MLFHKFCKDQLFTLFYIFTKNTFFQVKEQVQANVVITSAAQDERLLKILQGQGTCNM